MIPAVLSSRSTGSASSRATASTEARGHVHGDRPHAVAHGAELGVDAFGMTAGGDDPPPFGGVLADELAADAAAGAGDDDGGHGRFPLVPVPVEIARRPHMDRPGRLR
jgi:hypothetical protein